MSSLVEAVVTSSSLNISHSDSGLGLNISKSKPDDIAVAALPNNQGDAESVIFLAVFFIGFLAVILFYIWKKSEARLPGIYQYSVLNQFEAADPDLEEDYPEFTQGVILAENDSSSDEDVAFDRSMLEGDDSVFLGQPLNSLKNNNIDNNSLLFNNITMNPTTVAVPAQLSNESKSKSRNNFGTSSQHIEDSDEELLN